MSADISRLILDWYAQNARRLPWRGIDDPYATWVSEIMLQQTQVDTVIPYFLRWMERFPTLGRLANSSEEDVLRCWEGLGYYSRARNLHTAAQKVAAEYGGLLPSSRRELEQLPGIGPYTAGAIASIAFGLDEAALDGNIRRVLARLFDVQLPARSPAGEKQLWELARSVLPLGKAGDFNQALMDLGAGICAPKNPKCSDCPLQGECRAYALGIQDQRPVRQARPAVPHITVCAAVITRKGRVLIARRPSSGLLGGMWEFPGGKVEPGEELDAGLRREIREELDVPVTVGEPVGVYHHAYTHFRVTLHAFCCRLESGDPKPLEASEIRWEPPGNLSTFPMGKIDRQIARRINDGFPCI
jgi:A/G-specific adenine glycosylase